MSWLTGGERIQGNGKIIKQNREVGISTRCRSA
jgi:hypothetical protein